MYIYVYIDAAVSVNLCKCGRVDVTIEMLHGTGMLLIGLHQIDERSVRSCKTSSSR